MIYFVICLLQKGGIMKVNQVKRFVAANISRFEKTKATKGHSFNLYNKNNLFCGEFNFIPMKRCDYLGIQRSLSSTRIMDENRKLKMLEYVYIDKNYVTFKDKTSDILIKSLPKTITTVRTIIDFIEDKFTTVRAVSKLKNNLQRIGKDDADFLCSDKFIIYEALKEKPKYDKTIEIVKEGTISDVKKLSRFRSNVGVPFIYW